MLPRIALERVNVHLTGRHILKAISWRLDAAQHWAFVGANGSGKSTLLRVIAGSQWIDADGGVRTYSADGTARDSVTRAATWVRYVSAEQHERYARLDLGLDGRTIVATGFDDTLYLHRVLGAHEGERVDALLERLDLESFSARALRELSSGQLRRLLIARALVREPRVLVLDEFTNGLDRAARRDVLTFLDTVSPTVTLVVASHRPADFPAAITNTANVSEGVIVGVGAGRPAEKVRTALRARRAAAPATAADVLVRFRGADVYRGDVKVLSDVNWELRRGEHTAIRGANGAGKSTFAGLVAGTISAATGATVERFGETGPFDIWRLKQRIAHVSDDLQIAYDRGETVEAVIASGFPSSIGLFAPVSAGWRATVTQLIERLGIESLRGRTFTQLSFGERRKVLIARSLVRRPAIFILDEVWNGLDAAFRTALRDLLSAMAADETTLLVIAHDEDEDVAALTPRICTIENGLLRDAAAMEVEAEKTR